MTLYEIFHFVLSLSSPEWLWMDTPFTARAQGHSHGQLDWKAVSYLGKLNCLPFVSELFVLSVGVVSDFLLNRKDNFKLRRGYNVHSSAVQPPVVCGFVVRPECTSEELVWIISEFIFLLKFILYFIKWQKSSNLKAKAHLIWHRLKSCWEVCANTTRLFRYQANMCSLISWELCVALLWKRIWHCTQKPGHSRTSQLPKAYLNRIKELKLNNLMKHLPRSCLPKVMEDK